MSETNFYTLTPNFLSDYNFSFPITDLVDYSKWINADETATRVIQHPTVIDPSHFSQGLAVLYSREVGFPGTYDCVAVYSIFSKHYIKHVSMDLTTIVGTETNTTTISIDWTYNIGNSRNAIIIFTRDKMILDNKEISYANKFFPYHMCKNHTSIVMRVYSQSAEEKLSCMVPSSYLNYLTIDLAKKISPDVKDTRIGNSMGAVAYAPTMFKNVYVASSIQSSKTIKLVLTVVGKTIVELPVIFSSSGLLYFEANNMETFRVNTTEKKYVADLLSDTIYFVTNDDSVFRLSYQISLSTFSPIFRVTKDASLLDLLVLNDLRPSPTLLSDFDKLASVSDTVGDLRNQISDLRKTISTYDASAFSSLVSKVNDISSQVGSILSSMPTDLANSLKFLNSSVLALNNQFLEYGAITLTTKATVSELQKKLDVVAAEVPLIKSEISDELEKIKLQNQTILNDIKDDKKGLENEIKHIDDRLLVVESEIPIIRSDGKVTQKQTEQNAASLSDTITKFSEKYIDLESRLEMLANPKLPESAVMLFPFELNQYSYDTLISIVNDPGYTKKLVPPKYYYYVKSGVYQYCGRFLLTDTNDLLFNAVRIEPTSVISGFNLKFYVYDMLVPRTGVIRGSVVSSFNKLPVII